MAVGRRDCQPPAPPIAPPTPPRCHSRLGARQGGGQSQEGEGQQGRRRAAGPTGTAGTDSRHGAAPAWRSGCEARMSAEEGAEPGFIAPRSPGPGPTRGGEGAVQEQPAPPAPRPADLGFRDWKVRKGQLGRRGGRAPSDRSAAPVWLVAAARLPPPPPPPCPPAPRSTPHPSHSGQRPLQQPVAPLPAVWAGGRARTAPDRAPCTARRLVGTSPTLGGGAVRSCSGTGAATTIDSPTDAQMALGRP